MDGSIGTPKSSGRTTREHGECSVLPPRPIKITPIFSKKNAELVQLEDETIKEETSSGKRSERKKRIKKTKFL